MKQYETLARDMIENGRDPSSVAKMPFSFVMSVLRDDMEDEEEKEVNITYHNGEPIRMVNSFRDL